ncbi:MAG: LamG-like jellyroll fold domain-containing protein, partial [Planctomycetota bacterium]
MNESNSFNYVVQWDASEVLSSFTFNLTDDAGGRFAIDGSTGEITVADGSLVDFEAASSHNVTVQVTDAAGNSYSEAISITIDNGVEATQSVPSDQTTARNQTLTFNAAGGNAITVSDTVAAANSRMQVSLSVPNGVLTLSQTTGLTFVEGSNGSGSFVINGTESEINAALEGMTFTPDAGFGGRVAVDMTTSLDAELEGLYSFNDGTARDQANGIQNNGTLAGDAAVVTDAMRGEVLSLDGTGDEVQVSGLFGQPANVTLAAWVNLTVADSNGSEVISLGNNIQLRVDAVNAGADGIALAFRDGSMWQNVNSGVMIAGTGWNHVAATFDDATNTQTVYLNGEVIASGSFTNSIAYDQASDTIIGRHGDGSGAYSFTGLIDDARVYSRALSSDEIAAIAADTTAASDSFDIQVLNPVTTTSTSGGGLSINDDGGNDTYLIADDGAALLGGLGTLTYEVQFSSTDSIGDFTLLSYATPSNTNALSFYIGAGGDLSLLIDNAQAASSLISPGVNYRSLLDGQQHSLAFTWDNTSGDWEFFVDGVSVDSGTGLRGGTGYTIGTGGTLLLGQEQDSVGGGFDPNQSFSGTLFDARLFSDVRTA